MSDQEKMQEEFLKWNGAYNDMLHEKSWNAWQASRSQSNAEIAKRDAIIAMQAEKINSVLPTLQADERCPTAVTDTLLQALSASAESVAAWEAKKLESYEWLWSRCKIIFFPKADDKLGTYPIEHNPFARKDGRMFIEAKMKAELRAQSTQKKEGE